MTAVIVDVFAEGLTGLEDALRLLEAYGSTEFELTVPTPTYARPGHVALHARTEKVPGELVATFRIDGSLYERAAELHELCVTAVDAPYELPRLLDYVRRACTLRAGVSTRYYGRVMDLRDGQAWVRWSDGTVGSYAVDGLVKCASSLQYLRELCGCV